MQARLGHRSPRTTARDTPLTPPTVDVGHAPITARMAARCTRWSPPMPALADVCRRDGGEDLARCGPDLRPSHRRALDDLVHGRTAAFGGPRWPCAHGGPAPDVDHACRHRRGPTGHRLDTAAGLAARRQALRPVPSCPGVVTRPQALRALVRSPQKTLDDRWRRGPP